MSNKKPLSKKQWILYPFLLLIITLLILYLSTCADDESRFENLTETLFRDEISGSTLNLHYTLAYPENYGIEETSVLPIYTGPLNPSADKEEILSLLEELNDIDVTKLNERDAYTYNLLKRHLLCQLKGCNFPYYEEPFSPHSGVQSSLPILLADYTFRRKEDVEAYLDILEQSEAYLSGLLTYEKEKSDAGLFMADYSAQKVIDQCDVIMNEEELKSGTHFLHITFEERLHPLLENGEISQNEYDNYLSENDRLLVCIMRPAYEQVADTFTILTGSGKNEKGLYSYPQGREYYTYLVETTTGSDRSVAEIKRLLFADFQENYNALLALLAKYPELADPQITKSLDLPLSSPEEILKTLQIQMAEDFPLFPETTFDSDKSDTTALTSANADFSPGVTIKKVSPAMEDYSSPAYYLTPPIDDMSENIIYINGKNETDNLSLYTTLAHEGYPGHLYQTVFSQLCFLNENDSPLRSLLHYGGYVEGWAYYVEDLSYEYAKKLLPATPKTAADASIITAPQATDASLTTLTAAYYEACRLNRNIHICMYSLLDIAIHYDGASLPQVQKILSSIGITSETAAFSIYSYIVEEPVCYLKYYLGFLEMKLLRKEAMNLWGDSFSLYRFHEFILTAGPSDFVSLREFLLHHTFDIASVP